MSLALKKMIFRRLINKNVISLYSVLYTGMGLMSKSRFDIGNGNVKWAKIYEIFHKKNSGN